MSPRPSRIIILEQTLESAKAWLHAFDSEQLGVIDMEKFAAFKSDVSALRDLGIDVSRWIDIPSHFMNRSTERIYDYAVFGIRLRSLVAFLERQLEHEAQVQAVGGAPLTDEQIYLLRELVMANRNVAVAQRQEIVGLSADGETRFFHPGLPNRALVPNMVDLKRLTHLGMVNAYDRGGRKGWVIDVLPAGEAAVDALRSTARAGDTDTVMQPDLPEEFRYHVAISYAGSDIQYAEDLATLVEQEGYRVFFDKAKPAEVWGKNLHSYLQEIFAEQAIYCVIFASEEYRNRVWTNKELQDALGRQAQLRGSGEYILPIQLEKDVTLPGLPTSIAYLSIDDHSIEKIRDILVEKIETKVSQ